MRLRQFRDSDIPRVDEIWQENYSSVSSLPNRRNSIVDAVVEDDANKVIAYGQVKLFAEAMLFLDLSAPKQDRVQALILLMHEAFRGVEREGIQDLYSFIKDPDFALLIQRHFSFEIVDEPGELLLRRL